MEQPAPQSIENKIFTLRGVQVMLDKDLAELYGVTTGRLNEQVKRNIDRFPADFMFQLNDSEWKNLISQNAISKWGGRRKLPFAFTEQGVASLSGVLKSETAVKVHVAILRAFVKMRKFMNDNANVFIRLNNLEYHQFETDKKIENIFKAIENNTPQPDKGIFFNGQIFDAYSFVSNLIKNAENEIILIDNYIDESVLTLLSKRRTNIACTIYTKNISKQLQLDLKKHNQQYPPISVKTFTQSHDRFIIIDKTELYHFGASLKDLGKKWFAFSKMEGMADIILKNLPFHA